MLKSHIDLVAAAMGPTAGPRFANEVVATDTCELTSLGELNAYWLVKIKALPKNTFTEELMLTQDPTTFSDWMIGFIDNVLPTIQRFDLP